MGPGPQNLDRMTTIYGPTTWDVYSRLDESLGPRGPEMLYDLAAEHIAEDGTVLDAGCRDAAHLIELARRHPGITGIGIEPVALHVERALAAVQEARLGDRITIHQGVVQDVPAPDESIDFVWCRDVLVQVDDLLGGLRGLHRVMAPDARLLAYSAFATDRLDGGDLEMMRRHLGWLEDNARRSAVEAAFETAGFVIDGVSEIGTEWREYLEERTQPASKALLRLSRLRRQRDDFVSWRGQAIYDHVEANLHYEVFLCLGKLEPVIHVLRKSTSPVVDLQ